MEPNTNGDHHLTVSETALRRIVQESIRDAMGSYGIDTENPRASQADLLHLRKARIGSEELSKIAKRTAMGIALSAGTWALWEGVKIAIRQKTGIGG